MTKHKLLKLRLGAVGFALLAAVGCGSEGSQGVAGDAGPRGTNGTDGVDGTNGGEGPQGATGAPGTNGEDGESGKDGKAGKDGSLSGGGVFQPVPNGHALQPLGTFETGIFDEGASEILAHHPETQRVFVINAAASIVQVLELNGFGQLLGSGEVLDPSTDISEFSAGGVNSVAVAGDIVAVAVENDSKVMAGKIAFYGAKTLAYLGSVDVGALPDMVTFSPDGTKVLVANEAEQDRVDEDEPEEFQVLADPPGSVSVIDISEGVAKATVANLDFTAFDARLDEFRFKGVRYLPGDLATGSTAADPRPLSDDLEPEYIAVSPDGLQAFVTLQENNAFAVIDLSAETPVVSDVRPLGIKDFGRGLPVVHNFPIPDEARPAILEDVDTSTGTQDLLLGGLSALHFEKAAGDVYSFLTVPDRGPQIDAADLNAGHDGNERPHVMGDTYQAKIYRYDFDAGDEEFTGMPDEIPLFQDADDDATCSPVRGLANSPVLDAGEFAVDLNGNPLGWSPVDGDFEGLALDPDGDGYWLVDEYRPAIYFFSKETTGCMTGDHGLLQHRFVPAGTATAAGETLSVLDGKLDTDAETLPARYLERRANRGFEAVAIDPTAEILYAFIQSPLDFSGARSRDVIRILGLDIDESSLTFGQAVSEYLYFLEGNDIGGLTDKIGDAEFDPSTGRLLVIERDSSFGALGHKFIFEIELTGATNTLGIDDSAAPFETLEIDEILAAHPDLRPVSKRKIVNLPSAGYVAGDKPEGLALITEGDLAGSLAVLNDNDFGLEPALTNDGKLVFSTEYEKPVLGVITFSQSNGLDASDRDDAINITNWPVFGMYMPDAVASYAVGDHTYYVTANEGDSRDYDEARVKDLDEGDGLDASYGKVSDADFGRLKLSVVDGDRDYDGDIDDIHGYGARSFTIWDSLGNLVWDSGDIIERVTASAFPMDFNADNAENMSFDDRSDDKGPEPEGIVLGEIDGKWFAFVGLERMGGIMIFDISVPLEPVFVDYVTSRHFQGSVEYGFAGDLGPEGLVFVSADDSPTGSPLLIVGHEVSGTTTVFHVDL